MQNKTHSKRIALIGSRKLEEMPVYHKDIGIYFDYCYQLAKAGVVMTSGLCPTGPDAISQKAFAKAIEEGLASVSQYEVYVSEVSRVSKSILPYKTHSIVMPDHLKEQRLKFLSTVMLDSHLRSCDSYALGMHQRNVHQIFGLELDNPVDAVFTWCLMDNKGDPVGGTRTAYLLAKNASIPIINLFNTKPDEVTRQINEVLQK